MKTERLSIKKHGNDIITYVVENNWIDRDFMEVGWGNGYIMLPKEHPLYGQHYDDAELCDIHGGWTFSEFDEFEGKEYWVFGFDTCHLGDTPEMWPKDRVVGKIESVVPHFKKFLKK